MSQLKINSREDAVKADEADELKHFRERFIVPEGFIYLNGNSLGCCPRGMSEVVNNVVNEWATKLNVAYEVHRWHKGNPKLTANISKLIGAEADEVLVEGNTTQNIFKVLGTSIAIQKIDNPERRVVVLEGGNFSTDNHCAQGLVKLLSTDGYQVRFFDDKNPIESAIKDDTVFVLLSLVNWRTGELMDIKKITEMANKVKAHIVWDLSHAVGALPIDLHALDIDFAVGCTYKYLNGGTGAPSFAWVNKKHQDRVWSPLCGWRGHEKPFAFKDEFTPAKGMHGYFDGGSAVIQLEIARFSTDIFMDADINAIRKKSLQLTDLFIDIMSKKCPQLELLTPLEHERRGSHLAYRCQKGMEFRDYLRTKNVQLDFRNPDFLRIGFAPMYMSFVDAWDAAEAVAKAAAEIL